MLIPSPEERPIAVRAYATPATIRPSPPHRSKDADIGPSAWTLVTDIETESDAAQQLRFGTFQLRKDGDIEEAGLFYDPLTLTDAERSVLHSYAAKRGYAVYTTEEWIEEIFFAYVYDRNARYVGFNNPFDLSRLAIGHDSARGHMRGGFTFRLSSDEYRPRIQVKYLSSRAAFVRFTVPAQPRAARSQRKKSEQRPARRGYFVDVKTLAAALTAQSHSLKSLGQLLKTAHQKSDTDEHGKSLTEQYLAYAMNDVQVTWECYAVLQRRYAAYGLTSTPEYQVYSEASIGKAALKQMDVRPWRVVQPDVPPALVGIIMGTYYGGRAEVHARRMLLRVLYCDFLSMYPTVCTLMRLWPFVIATGITWDDGEQVAGKVRALLDTVTLDDLRNPETWQRVTTLVQVLPDRDLFPVRTRYGDEQGYSIGVNHLTSEEPLWFTLADCIAAKIITGKAPTILTAIRFKPEKRQRGLQSINIAGNPDYRVDPAKDDFYRRMIDLRTQVKRATKEAERAGDTARAATLDAEQLALKITTNATSYGIPAELNVTDHTELREVQCHGPKGESFSTWVRNTEEPGTFFHPLLATLITGAARLMLAIAERLATDAGITWAFCDTDSMALACPAGMDEACFLAHAERVRDWFTLLNPYAEKGPVFQIEGANYRLKDGKETGDLEPLYVLAVSAKRYVLFNLDRNGRPAIRKASAHGLGHLRPPYDEQNALKSIPRPVVPLHEIGVERWQYDLWYRIAQATFAGHPAQVRLDDLPGFGKPAVSRYAATTPELLRWFKTYNRNKEYRRQVRPFGFMVAFPARHRALGAKSAVFDDDGAKTRRNKRDEPDSPRVVAPFDPDPAIAASQAFDRETGIPVARERLQIYREAVAQYHLHPEAKFGTGDYTDSGFTTRRHITVKGIEHVGKEANRWEEQFYLGKNPEAQIVYGTAPEDDQRLRGSVLRECQRFGV